MMKQQDGKARIKIALVALLVSVVIALISVLFVSSVREHVSSLRRRKYYLFSWLLPFQNPPCL